MTPPTPQPGLEWLFTAEIDIGERQDLGPCMAGRRFMVPILGGTFAGPRLKGDVVPGGADRQFLRPDGVKELSAVYELRTHDGVIIGVDNRVLVDEHRSGERYARSVVRLSAADDSGYGWLNRRLLVGTLHSLRPQRQAVLIGVWLLD